VHTLIAVAPNGVLQIQNLKFVPSHPSFPFRAFSLHIFAPFPFAIYFCSPTSPSRALSLPHFQYALFHPALFKLRPHIRALFTFAHTFLRPFIAPHTFCALFTLRPHICAISHCATHYSAFFFAPSHFCAQHSAGQPFLHIHWRTHFIQHAYFLAHFTIF
jgi:hypothetical protein